MFTDEDTVMELLIYAGKARSDAMEAIAASRQKEWSEAERLIKDADEACRHAHNIQTKLIGADAGIGKISVNLILIHAQDHLMTAMLCYDLAKEIIKLRKDLLS